MLAKCGLEKHEVIADKLFKAIPVLAISGEESALDLILYEILELLINEVTADIGQINLLPKGGKIEKLCIVKDGKPWLRRGKDMHRFDPSKGFTGVVMATGKSVLVKDIWEKGSDEKPNPFLELYPNLNLKYRKNIKWPVGSIIILPVKRGGDIFCTIELSRYREREPFNKEQKKILDEFTENYGPLIMDYIVDIKDRIAINTAHKKLTTLSRFIGSNKPVDYKDAIEPYIKLSAADLGFVCFKTGGVNDSAYRLVGWQGRQIHEMLLHGFVPSANSLLRDTDDSFPIEGGGDKDERLKRFYHTIQNYPDLEKDERTFLLKYLKMVKSYVIYPLNMLNQDLGIVVLGSRHADFAQFLHMNPFLALYNSLLKSFLINERVIYYLSEISLKIHNPGFYCLNAIKGILVKKYPEAFEDPDLSMAIGGLDQLLNELHDSGKVLRWRKKNILFIKWLQPYITQKKSLLPGVEISLDFKGKSLSDCIISANEEQLETIFENLITNSLRAINTRRVRDFSLIGKIEISISKKKNRINILFKDNGEPYKTISGRGLSQIRSDVRDLGGNIRVFSKPYRVYLYFSINHKGRKG